MPPQDIDLALAALFLEPEVERVPRCKPGDRHHEVTARKTDQTLDAAVRHWARTNGACNGSLVDLSGAAMAITDQAMRQEPTEQPGSFAGASRCPAGHACMPESGAPVRRAIDPPDQLPILLTIVKDRRRYAIKEREGVHVPINLLPGRRLPGNPLPPSRACKHALPGNGQANAGIRREAPRGQASATAAG